MTLWQRLHQRIHFAVVLSGTISPNHMNPTVSYHVFGFLLGKYSSLKNLLALHGLILTDSLKGSPSQKYSCLKKVA